MLGLELNHVSQKGPRNSMFKWTAINWNEFDPLLDVKLVKNDQIVIDTSGHLLNSYSKFQIDISKKVEQKSGKLGRMDRRTDG